MIIQSKQVWIAGQFLAMQLEVNDGKITDILPYGTKEADEDYGEKRILPGFIDVHTHGAYGFDTNDAEPEGLRDWMKRIPEEGVTAILPTTVTQMPEVLTEALRNVAAVVKEGYEGAEILGVHFEGPYLDMEYKGAQPPEAIATAAVEQFKMYQEAAEGLIKYITMAPEHDRNFALTRHCRETGVRPPDGGRAGPHHVRLPPAALPDHAAGAERGGGGAQLLHRADGYGRVDRGRPASRRGAADRQAQRHDEGRRRL